MRKSSKIAKKTQSTQFVIKFENFNFDVWTVKFSPLISCNEDTGTYTLKLLGQFKWKVLQIAVNAKIIENRQKTQSTQFVIKFENFNFDVWTVKFSPLISCNGDTGTYTLKLLGQFKFQKFITNCGKCENHRKSPKKKKRNQRNL